MSFGSRKKGENSMQKSVSLLGIDLAKSVFWVRAEDELGREVMNRKVSRAQLFETVIQLKPRRVVMEACGGAHSWGRKLQAQGIEVGLIAPQHVRPFRRGDKNDANDTLAICEAARRPNLKLVRVKSEQQQDWQLVVNERASLVARRTEILNRLRSVLLEYDFVFAQGTAKLLKGVRELEMNSLSTALRRKIERDLSELEWLKQNIAELDRELSSITRQDPVARELVKIAGIGKVTAVAVRAAVTHARDFKNGRQLAAYWGLVPRQCSSGGKTRLLGIGKDGNRYIRQLLIHGARSSLRQCHRYDDPVSQWAYRKKNEIGFNKACVALANKNARVLWAVWAKTTKTEHAA